MLIGLRDLSSLSLLELTCLQALLLRGERRGRGGNASIANTAALRHGRSRILGCREGEQPEGGECGEETHFEMSLGS